MWSRKEIMVQINKDPNYKDYQICKSTSANDKTYYVFGIPRFDAPVCKAEYDFFTSPDDFVAMEVKSEIKADSEDYIYAGGKRKGQSITNFEQTVSLEIKADTGSRLWQRFSEIHQYDANNKMNGNYIAQVMDQGFFLASVKESQNGELVLRKNLLNLTCTSMPDDIFNNWDDNELTLSFEFTLNTDPFYETVNVPESFGVPTNKKAPKIDLGTITATKNSVSFTPTLTDTDMIALNDTVHARLFTMENVLVSELVSGKSGTELTLTPTQALKPGKYKVVAGYAVGKENGAVMIVPNTTKIVEVK